MAVAACLTALWLAMVVLTSPAAAQSFNAGLHADQTEIWGPSDAGWFYTPGVSYDLAGIATSFAAFGGPATDVTVGVYSALPSAGGRLLGQFSMFTNVQTGVWVSGAFASPIALVAGQSYFIDFSHLTTLNIAAPALGAGPFGFNTAGAFVSHFYFDQLTATPGMDPDQDIFSQPLLEFLPATVTNSQLAIAEPATFALALAGVLALALIRWRIAARR
jgi:hypothetical protein